MAGSSGRTEEEYQETDSGNGFCLQIGLQRAGNFPDVFHGKLNSGILEIDQVGNLWE